MDKFKHTLNVTATCSTSPCSKRDRSVSKLRFKMGLFVLTLHCWILLTSTSLFPSTHLPKGTEVHLEPQLFSVATCRTSVPKTPLWFCWSVSVCDLTPGLLYGLFQWVLLSVLWHWSLNAQSRRYSYDKTELIRDLVKIVRDIHFAGPILKRKV